MSANLDLVRSICAKWERGDYGSAVWAAPDIEFVLADGPTPGSWRGTSEMARVWRDYITHWRGARVGVEGYRELDSERVLVLLDFAGTGRTSGVEIARARARGANLFQLTNGSVTRLVLYFDRERALADLVARDE